MMYDVCFHLPKIVNTNMLPSSSDPLRVRDTTYKRHTYKTHKHTDKHTHTQEIKSLCAHDCKSVCGVCVWCVWCVGCVCVWCVCGMYVVCVRRDPNITHTKTLILTWE